MTNETRGRGGGVDTKTSRRPHDSGHQGRGQASQQDVCLRALAPVPSRLPGNDCVTMGWPFSRLATLPG